MSNNIDVVILGAGPPARGKLPSALKPISMNDKVIEWQMDCFKDCKKVDEIFFIGGYEFDKIVQQYPNLHFINNKEWEAGGALQSLLKLPFNDRDLMISYSDTLFRKDFINEIAKSVYENNWKLKEIRPVDMTLEEIFIKVVTEEEGVNNK